MKRTFILIAFLVISGMRAQSQYAIAGDTTGKYVYCPAHPQVNSSASVILGCADSAKVSFYSNPGGQHPYDWARLSFIMDSGVQVCNRTDIGWIRTFAPGDTIPYADTIWTPWLDFIWGMGGMGSYGVAQIDTQYVAFRNTLNNDTVYTFLKISTAGTSLTIHQIISACAANPYNGIPPAINGAEIAVYPNPFTQTLKVLVDGAFSCTLTNLEGRKILQWQNQPEIDTRQLPAGIYLLTLQMADGKMRKGKVIKQ